MDEGQKHVDSWNLDDKKNKIWRKDTGMMNSYGEWELEIYQNEKSCTRY
jgi:hypothetical protein